MTIKQPNSAYYVVIAGRDKVRVISLGRRTEIELERERLRSQLLGTHVGYDRVYGTEFAPVRKGYDLIYFIVIDTVR